LLIEKFSKPATGIFRCGFCGDSYCNWCFWKGKNCVTEIKRDAAIEKKLFKMEYDAYYKVLLPSLSQTERFKVHDEFIAGVGMDRPSM